jgi:signal transduction histidine kinase
MLVTHELKQPLTPIMGYADLLKEDIVDIEKLKFLDRIINGGQEMLDLITRIINLMKLESGELMFNFKEVSILKIIEEALRKKASFINLKNIRIEKKIKDVNFKGDFNLLRDVILNLIDNAVKFSPEKSIVTIKTSSYKNDLKIEVIDKGSGMKKEDLKNLFKSFKQSEMGRKKGGFGIGLAMSKMIIEKHNGIIYASSNYKKGSTFTIILPIKNNLGEKKI